MNDPLKLDSGQEIKGLPTIALPPYFKYQTGSQDFLEQKNVALIAVKSG